MTIRGDKFGDAAQDYASFRAGFPDSIYPRLQVLGAGLAGQNLVDVGTGTGTLARGFARRGLNVTGIDPDSRMLAQARELSARENLAIEFVEGTAERTGRADSSCDVLTAGQCWHWFDADAALVEARRVLRDGGKLVIAYFDWLPLAGNVVEATERLIESHNPEWRMGGGRGIHPRYLPAVSDAGFGNIETFSYDLDVPYSAEAWRGRIRASAGIVALTAEAAGEFDAALADLLARDFGADLAVPHRVWAVVADR